jgi:hypothetical protein
MSTEHIAAMSKADKVTHWIVALTRFNQIRFPTCPLVPAYAAVDGSPVLPHTLLTMFEAPMHLSIHPPWPTSSMSVSMTSMA